MHTFDIAKVAQHKMVKSSFLLRLEFTTATTNRVYTRFREIGLNITTRNTTIFMALSR